MSHMFLLTLIYTAITKVCPSWPSSEDHYILREIMFRRTKGINHWHFVLPCSYHIAFENKSPTLAPTSGELNRPPSASCDLRHAAEENFFRARGCTAATRRQSGHIARSSNSKEEGYKSDTIGGGAGPRDKGSRSYSLAVQKEEREDASSFWSIEEDRWSCKRIRHLTLDDQDRRPPQRELRQDNSYNDDDWYDDFHHGNFAFDDASPLSAELQATPWPPSYKPPQLPMYDGHSDSKQFLMSYEASISSYGGNTAVMAKSFVMAVRSVA
jgi:hypothetical protein